jgi:hypothetical protein
MKARNGWCAKSPAKAFFEDCVDFLNELEYSFLLNGGLLG